MDKLTRKDLWSLEQYAEKRDQFRTQVMAHKKPRRIAIGDHAALYFEDRLTMQYQIQEMLRIERIFETAEIEEELTVYNALIPDGSNWKATFMMEYSDVEQRRAALQTLAGIENQIWIHIGDTPKTGPIANEDLDRTSGEKTSAVHFMRFELNTDQIAALKTGADMSMSITHRNYKHESGQLKADSRQSLLADL